MLFNSAFVSGFLLAPVVLAGPAAKGHRSSFLNSTELSTDTTNEIISTNWAGAVWEKGSNTFNYVVGTFTVPTHVKGTGGASAWVGIDGVTCTSAILQAGVDFVSDGHGKTVYQAWYEWFPDYSHPFDLAISPGDVIRVYVKAYSPTKGIAKIHNLSTKKSISHYLESTHALCGQNAEWIIEDYGVNGKQVSLVDFGSVTFKDTKATGPGGTYTTNGAISIELVSDKNKPIANTKINGSSVIITYV